MNHDLHQAYLQTTYVASTPRGELRIRVGNQHPKLDALLGEHKVDGWAFVTAWNPGSELYGERENRGRQEALERELEAAGYVFFWGRGMPDGGDWAPEESVLVVGMSGEEAVAVGRRYGQAAVVCGVCGNAAELVWCEGRKAEN
jgi:hypothetical protein